MQVLQHPMQVRPQQGCWTETQIHLGRLDACAMALGAWLGAPSLTCLEGVLSTEGQVDEVHFGTRARRRQQASRSVQRLCGLSVQSAGG